MTSPESQPNGNEGENLKKIVASLIPAFSTPDQIPDPDMISNAIRNVKSFDDLMEIFEVISPDLFELINQRIKDERAKANLAKSQKEFMQSVTADQALEISTQEAWISMLQKTIVRITEDATNKMRTAEINAQSGWLARVSALMGEVARLEKDFQSSEQEVEKLQEMLKKASLEDEEKQEIVSTLFNRMNQSFKVINELREIITSLEDNIKVLHFVMVLGDDADIQSNPRLLEMIQDLKNILISDPNEGYKFVKNIIENTPSITPFANKYGLETSYDISDSAIKSKIVEGEEVFSYKDKQLTIEYLEELLTHPETVHQTIKDIIQLYKQYESQEAQIVTYSKLFVVQEVSRRVNEKDLLGQISGQAQLIKEKDIEINAGDQLLAIYEQKLSLLQAERDQSYGRFSRLNTNVEGIVESERYNTQLSRNYYEGAVSIIAEEAETVNKIIYALKAGLYDSTSLPEIAIKKAADIAKFGFYKSSHGVTIYEFLYSKRSIQDKITILEKIYNNSYTLLEMAYTTFSSVTKIWTDAQAKQIERINTQYDSMYKKKSEKQT